MESAAPPTPAPAALPAQETVALRPAVPATGGFPLPLPTTRTGWILAACAIPVALGFWTPGVAWFGLGAAVLTIAALVFDFLTLPPPAAFTAARDDRPVLGLGVEERIGVTLVCRAPVRGAVTVRLRDDLAEDLERVREPAPAALVTGEPVRFPSVVRPTSRGRRHLGSIHARVRSVLGLAEREIRFEDPAELRIYPGLKGLAAAARLLRQGLRTEAGDKRVRRRGEGTAFESLREYVRGEDPRHIDWKATARRGKLISRRYEVERSQNVILMIDCGRWMTGESGGLSRLDEALNAALVLAHISARQDDRVGVLAFSDRIEAFVPPAKGRDAVERIVRAVFDVQPRLVESDYGQAFAYLASKHRKRSLLVVFTDLLGADPNRMLIDEVRRASRRHLPLVVTMRDSDVEAQTDGVPENVRGVYEQAAAEEVLQERARGLAILAAGGAQVVDAAPDDLGLAAIDRYLEIKARMLL